MQVGLMLGFTDLGGSMLGGGVGFGGGGLGVDMGWWVLPLVRKGMGWGRMELGKDRTREG